MALTLRHKFFDGGGYSRQGAVPSTVLSSSRASSDDEEECKDPKEEVERDAEEKTFKSQFASKFPCFRNPKEIFWSWANNLRKFNHTAKNCDDLHQTSGDKKGPKPSSSFSDTLLRNFGEAREALKSKVR